MKEIRDIIHAFEKAQKGNKKAALATVVHVEGSSYRRPGARMLVTEDGEITGAISGGCLEGDALKKAMLAINQQQNKLVTYDTTDEDDLKFGVQLGCNGIVHILFEPIDDNKKPNALCLLKQVLSERRDTVLVTLFSLTNAVQPGTSLLYKNNIIKKDLPLAFEKEMMLDAQQALMNKSSCFKQYKTNVEELHAFVEFIAPPVSIAIVGAGNDAKPLVDMAALLGWQITVVDGRATHATHQRFTKADKIIVAKPTDILPQLTIDEQTAFIIMTHNYNYDVALLKQLLAVSCAYIGVLGPKKKLHRMFNEISEKGIVITDEQAANIYGPVGLDIGAETPEEIAVSIIAEIKAVLSHRNGTFLKEKDEAIHSRTQQPIMNHTGIIILAAGSASRFGSAKQLVHFNKKSLLQHAIDEAVTAQLALVIVVTGANAELISDALPHHSIEVVYNEHWQQGMASSIVAGLSKIALNKDIHEVIITVCDQPFVTARLFTDLCKKKTESGKNIVACAYADTIGTPVLFTEKYFDKLLHLQGDEGAKKLLKLHKDDIASIPFPQGVIDIDTKKDFEKLLNHQQHIL